MTGRFTLVVSTEILLEYEEKIAEKSTPTIAQNILDGFDDGPNVYYQEIYFTWNLIQNDPDDNKFTDCYIAAGADYLVSNDRHFNVLKNDGFPPVRVVSTEAFLDILAGL